MRSVQIANPLCPLHVECLATIVQPCLNDIRVWLKTCLFKTHSEMANDCNINVLSINAWTELNRVLDKHVGF